MCFSLLKSESSIFATKMAKKGREILVIESQRHEIRACMHVSSLTLNLPNGL